MACRNEPAPSSGDAVTVMTCGSHAAASTALTATWATRDALIRSVMSRPPQSIRTPVGAPTQRCYSPTIVGAMVLATGAAEGCIPSQCGRKFLFLTLVDGRPLGEVVDQTR